MRKTECGSQIQVYRLPRIADDAALTRVAERLLSTAGNLPFNLEFAGTTHIDYRALRRFVLQVRRLGAVAKPIVLSGLDPYCEAIVHFTLTTKDWELFTQAATENRDGASRGNDAAAQMDDSRLVRFADRRRASLFFEPCPN